MMGSRKLAESANVNRLDLLRQASILIEDQLVKDSYPGLDQLCKNRSQVVQGRGGSFESESCSKWNFLKKDSFKSLPDFILQQYECISN